MSSPTIPANALNKLGSLDYGGGISPDVLARVSRSLQAQSALAPKLNAAINADKTKLSGYGQLQSALAGFQDVVKSLSGSGLSTNASSSSSKTLSATSSASAASGNYAVQVSQLAQGQVLQSKLVKAPDTALAADLPSSIKIELGSVSNNSFTPNAAAGSPKSIVITAANSSLQGIASAINDAKTGVTAKVVQSGGNYALSLSTPTGTANTLRISVAGDSTVQKLLAYNPAGAKNLTEVGSAQNAQLRVNGKDITSQTNTITDAVAGTTLKLLDKGSADVVIKQDNQQISKNVGNLVSTFNALNGKLRSLQQNELKGDRSTSLVQDQFARSLKNASSIASDGTSLNLEKIGITFGRNGDLALDDAKLQAAITTDPAAVAQLFTNSSSGITETLNNQIKSVTGSGGSIAREVATVTKDIAALNQKKDSLSKALTIQANALVRQYSQQSGQTTDASGNSQIGTLFDFLG